MSRKRNRSRRPKTQANNKWGPRTVGFDGDHLMQGVDPPLTKNRNPANRRGGNNKSFPNKSFPNRSRGGQPHHNGNNRASGPHNGQTQRRNNNSNNNNLSNPHTNKRKRRNNTNNNDNNPSTSADASSDFDIFFTSPPPLPFATSPSSSSSTPNNANRSGISKNGPNTRFCTECSAVRRANLRFRNWAARAIRACGERFCEWADDAGVGFESVDEMDWQPEPVIRVLLVGASTPNPFYPCLYPGPSYGNEAEQHGGVEGVGVSMGGDPRPGPWPWPPFNWYENPTVPTISARVPSIGLPSVPVTMEDVPLPDFSILNTNTNANNNSYINNTGVGVPMPVSGFGLLGAGCAGCAAEERESRLWSEAQQQPSVPARAPPQAPTVTSTCGPTRMGVPSTRPFGQSFLLGGRRRRSRDSSDPY